MLNRSRTFILLAIAMVTTRVYAAAGQPQVMTWTVDGVKREAIVFAPSAKSANGKAPVVLSFHGHGDTMENFSGVSIEKFWPEAVVVYPQGLPTSRAITFVAAPGWEVEPGDQGDRDLKLVDAMLADLRQKYKVDDNRIYATGFSNGANFTYLLWSQRPKVFAAFAPVAAKLYGKTHLNEPKPLLHIAGRADQQIAFKDQEDAIEAARKADATGRGESCGNGCTLYTSANGTQIMTMFHDGGHVYPAEASPAIVKFFKAHPLGTTDREH